MKSPKSPGAALAEAALALEGTRFRLHGRHAETGLDCIGLLHAALAAIGRKPVLPNGYRLRSRVVPALAPIAVRNGFAAVTGRVTAGDVLSIGVGGCQHHMMIAIGGSGFVHAHAGIGRVALHLGALPGTLTGHWRLVDASPG